MPIAAQLTNLQACPAVSGPIAHVGGPILGPGASSVLLCSLPASCLGDSAMCAGPLSQISSGFAGVLVMNKPVTVVEMSTTTHGGVVMGPGAINIQIGPT